MSFHLAEGEVFLSLDGIGFPQCGIAFPRHIFNIVCRVCLIWDAAIVDLNEPQHLPTMGDIIINDFEKMAKDENWPSTGDVNTVNEFIINAIQYVVFIDLKYDKEYELLSVMPTNLQRVIRAPENITEWWCDINPTAANVLKAINALYDSRVDVRTQIL